MCSSCALCYEEIPYIWSICQISSESTLENETRRISVLPFFWDMVQNKKEKKPEKKMKSEKVPLCKLNEIAML